MTALSKVTSCRAAKGEARTWPARERQSMRLPGRGAVPCRRMQQMEGHGSWWASQSSKLPTDLTVRGGFDSHSPPPRYPLITTGFRSIPLDCLGNVFTPRPRPHVSRALFPRSLPGSAAAAIVAHLAAIVASRQAQR